MAARVNQTSAENTVNDGHSLPQPVKLPKKYKYKTYDEKKKAHKNNIRYVVDSINFCSEAILPSLPSKKCHETVNRARDKFNNKDRVVQETVSKTAPRKRKYKNKNRETSSEEERWLDAVESGNLGEGDDELKTVGTKDPKLMTARQRALFERRTVKETSPDSKQLLALPSRLKEKDITAETMQKSLLKAQKRKQIANEKRHKVMQETLERLLTKQKAKVRKRDQIHLFTKTIPCVSYRMCGDSIYVSMPVGVEFPMEAKKASDDLQQSRPTIQCGVKGCTSIKKYRCASTGIPLCSLSCFLKNTEGSVA